MTVVVTKGKEEYASLRGGGNVRRGREQMKSSALPVRHRRRCRPRGGFHFGGHLRHVYFYSPRIEASISNFFLNGKSQYLLSSTPSNGSPLQVATSHIRIFNRPHCTSTKGQLQPICRIFGWLSDTEEAQKP